jgi:hypothetical protein
MEIGKMAEGDCGLSESDKDVLAISALLKSARADATEQAAKIADEYTLWSHEDASGVTVARRIAERIRSLKGDGE